MLKNKTPKIKQEKDTTGVSPELTEQSDSTKELKEHTPTAESTKIEIPTFPQESSYTAPDFTSPPTITQGTSAPPTSNPIQQQQEPVPITSKTTTTKRKQRVVDQDYVKTEEIVVDTDVNSPRIGQKSALADIEKEPYIARGPRPTYSEFGNMTIPENIFPSTREPTYIAPDLSKEALLADIGVRGFVNNMDEISTKLGIEVKKSNELAVEWKQQISALDAFIKSLSGSWKNLIIYSACFLLVSAFIYKMALWRMLPNFATNLIQMVPTNIPSPNSVTPLAKELPKPDVENILNTALHTPMTPLAIVAGVGTLSIAVGVLKSVLWILRKTK